LPAKAGVSIDARGLAVAPGFLDTHSHSRRNIFREPSAENLVRQGITTVVEGPDGSSPIPLKPFLEKLAATPLGINFGMLMGQGSIREKVIGLKDRKATAEEIETMRSLARQAMLDGAFGISTGLFYLPGTFTPTEEIIALATVVGELGGIHQSHMRDEAAGILDSVRECIRIGEEGGLPTQLTHHKIIGRGNWGRSAETIRLVEAARARGVDATIDQYPYTASSTGTGALFPQWALESGRKALVERLAAPGQREKIKAEIVRRIQEDRGGGDPKNVSMASCDFDHSLDGKNLAEITAARGVAVTLENAAETAIEIQTKGGCSAVYHAISEEDVERILRSRFTMVASDGGVLVMGEGVPHPRNNGTFPRVLGRYVRERGVLTLEEALRKMTSFPAQRFRIANRGLLRPGMKADVVVFDPRTIADKADFANPHQYAVGVQHVLVNGKFVLRDGNMSGARPGAVLYGPSTR
jgi:dihydroorotase/N-acyl-D-amino-acid deacylase